MPCNPSRFVLGSLLLALPLLAADRVKVAGGTLEGTSAQPAGVRAFLGVPFGQPPTGDLRWREPQPVKPWTGVRQAGKFGPRCMQQPVFNDMVFRSDGVSEDCLYLNVWTPAKSGSERLPVLVYFFGGGFIAGDGSESRYEGASMAAKGVVAVSVNYRLGIFGFFAHPELTKESPHHASGNYALLDQSAALKWVHDNIAAFGGDPRKVTIAGESAGSISVSAQMASPLSRDLIAGAIGESGSIMGALSAAPLAQVEAQGTKFAASQNAADLAALRAIPAQKLLDAAGQRGMPRFTPAIDGYFFPESPFSLYSAGKQAHVPLLAGWNSEEANARAVLGNEAPTRENFEKAVQRLYPNDAKAVLAEYAPASDADVLKTATDLASDRFIAWSTWKWIDTCAATGGKPVYRYFYTHPRPAMLDPPPHSRPATGAVHSAEIEYAMGNLDGNKAYAWTAEDRKVSTLMQGYFANFIKTGDPNGSGLPKWPAIKPGADASYMRIDVEPKLEMEAHRGRYLLLERLMATP